MFIQNKPIQTANRIISVRGKIFHSDRRRRIDLKKPIRDLFESGSSEILYTMELCLSKKKLASRIDELVGQNVFPVLLYFIKNGGDTE